VALLAMMASGRRVTRMEGAVLVVAYALYIALIVGGAAPGKA
jgi:Ca2+/Na+ antiporter